MSIFEPINCLLLLLLSLSTVVLSDCVVGNCRLTEVVPLMALTITFVISLWWIAQLAVYACRWWLVRLKPESVVSRRVVPLGPVQFDPVYGLISIVHCPLTGQEIEVSVNPEFWRFLPSNPTVNREEKAESAIVGTAYSKVSLGTEPSSLVALKTNNKIVGFGCRIAHEGQTYLLTAAHVWKNPACVTALSKSGYEVAIDADWKAMVCEDPLLDFALVSVPPEIWSRLKVKAAKVGTPSKRVAVTLYGGQSTTELLSGFGSAEGVDESAWKMIHYAPTAPGWSGTPLYSKNGVVGIHLGYEQIGRANRAVNLPYILRMISRNETDSPDSGIVQISLDEMLDRVEPFHEVVIDGFGKVALGVREYAVFKPKSGKYWADMEDDNMDDYYADLEQTFQDARNENAWDLEQPLNCQGAAQARPAPPSLNLEVMTGLPKVSSPPVDKCSSSVMESRLVSLERLVESLLQRESSQLETYSQSLKSLTGQIEALQRSCNLLHSKQESSEPPKLPTTLIEPLKPSSSGTRVPEQNPASEQKIGAAKTSGKPSRRRRSRKKSTAKPPQASPSQS